MSVATIAMVATYAMAAYSTVVAIKALADGDYTTALIAGVGAFAGFSAAGGMASNIAASTAGNTVNASLQATQTLGGIGAAPTAGAMSTVAPTASVAPAAGLAGIGQVAPVVAGFSPAPVTAAAVAPPVAAPTGVSGLSSMFKDSGIGGVIDGVKQIGADLFQDMSSGNLMNKAGESLGNLGGGSTLGNIAQVASPLLKYSAQKDQQEAADKQREAEQGYIDRDWANRQYIPNIPSLR